MNRLVQPMDIDSFRAIHSVKDRYNVSKEAFQRQLCVVAAENYQWMVEAGYSIYSLAPFLEINPSTVERSLNRKGDMEHTFKMPIGAFIKYSYNFRKMSCHELLFGIKGKTKLPRFPSGILRFYMMLTDEEKSEICGICMTRSLLRKMKSENESGKVETREQIFQRLLARCKTLADDHSIPIRLFAGAYGPHQINMLSRNSRTGRTSGSIQFKTLMYLAMEYDTSVDYFIAPNYLDFTEAVFFGSNEAICDESALLFIKLFLSMQPEDQDDIAKRILVDTICGKNCKNM